MRKQRSTVRQLGTTNNMRAWKLCVILLFKTSIFGYVEAGSSATFRFVAVGSPAAPLLSPATRPGTGVTSQICDDQRTQATHPAVSETIPLRLAVFRHVHLKPRVGIPANKKSKRHRGEIRAARGAADYEAEPA